MRLKKLKRKLTVEFLWFYILLLLKKRPMYAYEIKDKIKEEFGFESALITPYVTLYELRKEGYVEIKWKVINGRRRKYYQITEKGIQLLENTKSFLRDWVLNLLGEGSNP